MAIQVSEKRDSGRSAIIPNGILIFMLWWPTVYSPKAGSFYVMPKVDIQPLAELFRALVLKILLKEGRIDNSFIKMIMAWHHGVERNYG